MHTDPEVDAYIDRSELWPQEMAALRPLLLRAGLREAIKWNKPCYEHEGRNVVIMQEMKGFLALMFFKGAVLDDPDGALEEQGPNSRSARRITFTSTDEVIRRREAVAALVADAIAAEEEGREVETAEELELPDELGARLDADDGLRTAFEALTPGRQRAYVIDISGAKRAETRTARVQKHTPRILAGKGLHDR